MKLTPSSTARCTTRTAVGTSDGGPQMPGPVMRIAPKPSRFTLRSPPSVIWPAALALAVEVMARHLRELDRLKTAGTATLQAAAYIEHGLCPSDGRTNWTPRPPLALARFAGRRARATLHFIHMDNVDVVVIGAGVVGLAVARALAARGREVLILEAADHFGTGVSSRNS